VLSSATLSTSLAYIGDSTSERARGGGMGLLGAAAGAGTIIGPGLGGLLANDSLTMPFFIAAGMSLLSLLSIAFLLPESLPREMRTSRDKEMAAFSLRPLINGLKSPIGFPLFLAFFATLGTSNFEATYSLFMVAKLDYSTARIGLILTVVGVIALVGRGLLTGAFTRRWGETNIIKSSFLAITVGYILLLLANSFATVLLATGFFSFAITFLRPSIHSLTSQRATIGQGTAMGLSNSCVSLGRIVGALCAGMLFDLNTGYPYWVGAAIALIGFTICQVGFSDRLKIDPKAPAVMP
jgi:DHA1 family multidrug resistance protein-like MFS transporter